MPEEAAAMMTERERRMNAGESTQVIDRELAGRKQKVLAERRFFIESRLTTRAVVDVFRLRDKILIDGTRRGRRASRNP